MTWQFRPARVYACMGLALACLLACRVSVRAEEVAVSYDDISQITGIINTWQSYHRVDFGAGTALEDLDNDGDADLVLLNNVDGSNRLFLNQADGEGNGYPTFDEVTQTAGLSNLGNSKGIVIADYNNDGLKDIFIANYDTSIDNVAGSPHFKSCVVLYRNNGDGTFSDITAEVGLLFSGIAAHGLSAADIDNDGWVDLFVSNRGVITDRGGPNVLFRNQGDGTFADISAASGIADVSTMTFQSGFLDYDDDGDQDIYLCTDKHLGNQLYRNNGNGVFENVSASSGADIKMDGMSVTIGDYDNDLDLDVFVTNTPGGHALMRNNSNGTFTNVAVPAGVASGRTGWGAQWMDADSDGHLDLYVVHYGLTNGNQLYMNQGNGNFVDIAPTAGCVDPADGYGLARGDLDNDGKPDFVVSNWNNSCGVYQHTGTASPSLRLKLVGTTSNRDALGARVLLYTNSGAQLREVRAGDSYLSHSETELHFGLGVDVPTRVDIRWPSGQQQSIVGVQAAGRYRVVEGHGIQNGTLLTAQSVEQMGDEVTLDWETVQWPDDNGFRIERVVPGKSGQSVVLAEISDAGRWFTWTDTDVPAGTHRYRVSVLHPTGPASLLFETDDVLVDPTPVRLHAFEAAATEGTVHLRWKLDAASVRELFGVHVQRAAAAEGPFEDVTDGPLEAARDMQYVDTDPTLQGDQWYRLRFLNSDGTVEMSPTLHTSIRGLLARSQIASVALQGTGKVRISYAIGRSGPTQLQVFDIRGRLVDTLVHDSRVAGSHSLTWNRLDRAGRPVARGLYVLRLTSTAGNDARKLVLLQR